MISAQVSRFDRCVPLHHFWSVCVGAGRANEGLRAGWQEQLKLVHDQCGFRYCRFHGLFHDDMFVFHRGLDGLAEYNFQYIDDVFDRMLQIGVRPFVEFGFCPADLASEHGTVFWWKGHGSPPKDYAEWGHLIDATVRHWVERYGLAEVQQWYFEVWNEPNLHPFFRGSRSQYFELYRTTALALKLVDGALRVGGPATSNFVPDTRFAGEVENVAEHGLVVSNSENADALDVMDWRPVWVEEFVAFCHREKLPIDFVSCHPYPTDWALDSAQSTVRTTRGVGATPRDLRLINNITRAGPFPDAEIHLTEWSSSPSPRDHTHDYLQAATFIVRANIESIGLVDSMSYWTFTDIFEEGGAGDACFHGGFGMMTYQGIPKPTFHAYRFLHRLGDELMTQSPGAIVTRHSTDGRLTAVAYHYPDMERRTVPGSFDSVHEAERTLATGAPVEINLTLNGLKPGASVRVETLDQQHGNPMHAWQAMGQPSSPTPTQVDELKVRATPLCEMLTADESGKFALQRMINPWSVVLFEELPVK